MAYVDVEVEYDIMDAWNDLSQKEREEFISEWGASASGSQIVEEYIYRIKYLHLDTEKSALEILEEIEGILR